MLRDTGTQSKISEGISGRAEKAIIIIYDGREIMRQIESTEVKDWSVVKTDTPSNLSIVNSSTHLTYMTTGGIDVALGAVMQDEAAKGHYKRQYHVKFNPSSISINASGGGSYPKEDSGSEGVINYETLELHYYFSVDLILDNYNFDDCFMNHTTNISASSVVGGVVSKNMKKAISVREQVEAFHAALMGPYTRYMAFCWGPMLYEGLLKSISTDYTMFDRTGNPVRANLHLEMELIDYKSQVVIDGQQSLGTWQKSFDLAFNENGTLNANGEYEIQNKTVAQMYQNFLNLG